MTKEKKTSPSQLRAASCFRSGAALFILFFASVFAFAHNPAESGHEEKLTPMDLSLVEDLFATLRGRESSILFINENAELTKQCEDIGHNYVVASYQKLRYALKGLTRSKKNYGNNLDPDVLGATYISQGCPTGHMLNLIADRKSADRFVIDGLRRIKRIRASR